MKQPILIAQELRKAFGDNEAVRGISFSVMRGEIFSLLGPNGAGKTTTINMLSCLIEPTGGTAEIAGHAIPGDSLDVRRAIGVVPQEIALYDSLTARQNLEFWGKLYDMGGKPLAMRIDEVLEQVGLSDRAKDKIKTYSGGMKRRINIAAGLLHKPQLLFMDEPTVGIDPQSRRRILDMVRELRDQGMTILYTTHYMEEAEELSDRVGIIDQGRLIALGTQVELTKLVGEQETLRLHLAEDMPLPDGKVDVFAGLEGVLSAAAVDHQVIVNVADAGEALPAVVARAGEIGLRIRSVDIEEPNLEAVFLHLTGRGLRD
ncbi:MAG: ATP-binding cassette domain-containing protein [Anaerolineales bacterium]|uniref:ABC transporter ATP-binding protein n=1 Tax=Promineifilum sp. TaxID=2664178 RepID=UPI001D20B5CB|nr:ATP-binding cassette domain-containing protein [Anaerolineales bacterium]MCO5181648.1 ATP-binding cassette domain-containing protein [Promineifilum sp.]